MTRTDHLLVCLAEECNEVAQRAAKALRFGLEEVQQGQELNNGERLTREFEDLLGVFSLLMTERCVPAPDESRAQSKLERFEKYLGLSAEKGRLCY